MKNVNKIFLCLFYVPFILYAPEELTNNLIPEEQKQWQEKIQRGAQELQLFLDTLKPFEQIASDAVLHWIPNNILKAEDRDYREFIAGIDLLLIPTIWELLLEFETAIATPFLDRLPTSTALKSNLLKGYLASLLKSIEISWNAFLPYFYSIENFYSIEKPEEGSDRKQRFYYSWYLSSQTTIPLLGTLLQQLFDCIPLIRSQEDTKLLEQLQTFKKEFNDAYVNWCNIDEKNRMRCESIKFLNAERKKNK